MSSSAKDAHIGCVRLLRSPCVDSLRNVMEEVKHMDKCLVRDLQQILIFPLRATLVSSLKKRCSEQLTIETCQALETVLRRSQLANSAVFLDFISILSEPPMLSSTRQLSQEVLAALLGLLSTLMLEANADVLYSMYRPRHIALFGCLISQLVGASTEMKFSRKLRIQALDVLIQLLRQCTNMELDRRWRHGNQFATLLPGVLSATLKVLIGDANQGLMLFCKALEAWTEIVRVTLGDESIAQEIDHGDRWISEAGMPQRLKELLVVRSADWVRSVVPRVEFMVQRISELKGSSHWRFRRQLVVWSSSLLSDCSRSLESCRNTALSVLILLMNDPYRPVADPARQTVDLCRTSSDSAERFLGFVDFLKENIYCLVASLPKQIMLLAESEKIVTVNLLKAYVSTLGPNVKSLIMSVSHLTSLARALVNVLEIDVSDQKILEENGVGSLASHELMQFVEHSSAMKPRIVFAHFRDDSVLTGLRDTCRLLGQYGNLGALVATFWDLYFESVRNQLACAFILNEVLVGCAVDRSGDVPDVEEVIGMLISDILTCESVDITASSTGTSTSLLSSPQVRNSYPDDNYDSPTLQYFHRNHAVMLTCLFLECISSSAEVLGVKFQSMLRRVLYPVVGRLGSELSAVSSTAYMCLSHISRCCRHNSVGELIQHNADYLVESISQHIRHSNLAVRAASVLSVIIRFCDMDIFPVIWDNVLETLDKLDEHHSEPPLSFLTVLLQFMSGIQRWYPPKENCLPTCRDTAFVCKRIAVSTNKDSLCSFLVDRRSLKKQSEDFHTEYDADNDVIEEGDLCTNQTESVEYSADSDQTPLSVTAVQQVLQRAKHLLGSRDRATKLMMLDIISRGCSALVDDHRNLLPLIHDIWPSLKQRFSDKDLVVVAKSVITLQNLCTCSGDFVRQRVVKDAFPVLTHFLLKQAQISENCCGSYVFTLTYRLQHTVLSRIGDVAVGIGLDDIALDGVVQCVVPYLSQLQPDSLQRAAMKCCRSLMHCNSDIVWLWLCNLHVPFPLVHMDTQFNPLSFPAVAREVNLYSSNVSSLLNEEVQTI